MTAGATRDAILHIIRDNTPPSVLSSVASCVYAQYTNILITFSEGLQASSAQNVSNYVLNNGVTVQSATLLADGKSVVLQVSPPLDKLNCTTVTVSGIADLTGYNTASGKFVTVVKTPVQATGPQNLIVVEVEDYDFNRSPGVGSGATGYSWVFERAVPGYQGSGYMTVEPAAGGLNIGNIPPVIYDGPRLDYCINFPVAGTYYVWARGSTGVNDGSRNSCHMAVDGVSQDEFSRRIGNRVNNWGGDPVNFDLFGWTNDANSPPAQVTIAAPGLHIINILVRESGMRLDRFLLTTDAAFSLGVSDVGPGATGREPIPSLGIARDVAGNARISWTGQGWLLQGTTELNSNPAATVWQDLPQFSSSPLLIPAGYFGSGPTNVFFRLICK